MQTIKLVSATTQVQPQAISNQNLLVNVSVVAYVKMPGNLFKADQVNTKIAELSENRNHKNRT